MWSCCGFAEHYSLYCESLEVREKYALKIATGARRKVEEVAETAQRKQNLIDTMNNIQKQPDVKFVSELTFNEEAMEKVGSSDHNFNAPIMVELLIHRFQEEPTLIQGLGFLLKHLETGDGCFMMHRHGVVRALGKTHEYYMNPIHPPIQLQILSCLRRCGMMRFIVKNAHCYFHISCFRVVCVLEDC
jgi:hypothetical protein